MYKQASYVVKGMTCKMCVKHVSEALQTVPGTHDVEVDLQAGTANFMYDPGLVTDEQLKEAVEEAGYELEGSLP